MIDRAGDLCTVRFLRIDHVVQVAAVGDIDGAWVDMGIYGELLRCRWSGMIAMRTGGDRRHGYRRIRWNRAGRNNNLRVTVRRDHDRRQRMSIDRGNHD